jgi:Asp-tRNA(Asn)/Glu-tRNA(Gln) amidotransferase A subunit family amidase
MGKHFDETTILGVAAAIEREVGFERKLPIEA